MSKKTAEIAALNDEFRQTHDRYFGKVYADAIYVNLPPEEWESIFNAVAEFSDFNTENMEHQFGEIPYKGRSICWAVYYFNRDESVDEDSADPSQVMREMHVWLGPLDDAVPEFNNEGPKFCL